MPVDIRLLHGRVPHFYPPRKLHMSRHMWCDSTTFGPDIPVRAHSPCMCRLCDLICSDGLGRSAALTWAAGAVAAVAASAVLPAAAQAAPQQLQQPDPAANPPAAATATNAPMHHPASGSSTSSPIEKLSCNLPPEWFSAGDAPSPSTTAVTATTFLS